MLIYLLNFTKDGDFPVRKLLNYQRGTHSTSTFFEVIILARFEGL